MSDLDKIDKLEKAIKFVKENSVVVGFLLAAVPIIGGAFYTGITELNKAKDALSQFTEMTEGYAELKNKVKALETANETRAQIVSIKAEVQAALDAVKVEMNAIRRATTNRLGN